MAARLLFPGLWMLADREGRLEYRPKRWKGELFPYDNIDTAELFAELETNGLVKKYESDGVMYVWIPKFRAHQNPHQREQKSIIPPHPEDENIKNQEDGEENQTKAKTRHDLGDAEAQPRQCPARLNPESPSLNPESTTTSTACARASTDEAFAMATDWQPSEYFATLAETSGLHPPPPDEREAAAMEFRAYWLTQKRRRTTHEWDLAFIKALKSGFANPRGKPRKNGNRQAENVQPRSVRDALIIQGEEIARALNEDRRRQQAGFDDGKTGGLLLEHPL